MKCTICGRRTLPGAKLCLPCRSALRRARDDTVSELMPLPARAAAFGIPGASTVSRTLDLIETRRAKRRPRKSTGDEGEGKGAVRAYSPLRVAAIALFVMAIGVVAYGFTEQLQGEPASLAAHEQASVPAPRASVSPVAMAAEARNTMLAAPVSHSSEAIAEAGMSVSPPVEIKPRKSPSSAARPIKKVDAPTMTPVVVVPPVVTAAAAPAAAPVVAPDRWQLLSAALGRCNGNLFERIGCEHVARAKYCEGYWGQVSQCPGGVSNDHGQ